MLKTIKVISYKQEYFNKSIAEYFDLNNNKKKSMKNQFEPDIKGLQLWKRNVGLNVV